MLNDYQKVNNWSLKINYKKIDIDDQIIDF